MITTAHAYRPFGKPLRGKSLYKFFFFLIGLFVFFDSFVRCVCVHWTQVLEVYMSCKYLLLLCDSHFDLIASFDQQKFFSLMESRVVILSSVVTAPCVLFKDCPPSQGHKGSPLCCL